jgi:tetratricopeptide (TPR) repeat protein
MLRRVLLGLLAGYFAIASTGAAISSPTDMDGVRSLRSLALEQHMRGESDTAMSTYDNALKMATDLFGKKSTYVSEILYEQAVVALACKRYPKAEECLQSSLEINPNSISARLKLAEYLKLKGRTQEARQQARKVLAKHKDSLEARQIMALTYQEEGNAAKATQECFFLDEAMHGKARSEAENVAFTPPPPATIAPPAISIPLIPTPPPAATSKPIPSMKQNKKLEPPHKIKAIKIEKPKPKPVAKPAPKPAPKQPIQTAVFHNNEASARLKSKAILLTPIKKAKNTSASSESVVKDKPAEKPPVEAAKPAEPEKPKKATPRISVEEPVTADNGDGSEEQAEEPVKKAPPKKVAPKPVPVMQPFKIEPVKKPRPGLVPPPPPVVPIFPGMMMPQTQAPPPMQVVKPKPKPVEKHVETPKEHAGGSDEDSDFLIEWAGKKKK